MFVRVSQLNIQFSQKLLALTVIFAALIQGSVFHPEFLFSDEVWRLLPGETSK